MKNKWEIETKDSPVKNEVLPITVPVIRNDFYLYVFPRDALNSLCDWSVRVYATLERHLASGILKTFNFMQFLQKS